MVTPPECASTKAPKEEVEVESGQQIQQTIDAVVTQSMVDNNDVIMIEDSSDGFLDAAKATQEGKEKLLCQAKRDKKEKTEKAQAEVDAKAATQTSLESRD